MKILYKGSGVLLAGMFLVMIPVILGDPLEAITNLLSMLGGLYILTGISNIEKVRKKKPKKNLKL